MSVPPVLHLFHKDLMAQIEGLQPPSPSDDFRVTGIPFFVIGKNRPYCMEFSMFTKQVVATQYFGRKIPNSHIYFIVSEASFRSVSRDLVSSLILHAGKINFIFSMVIPLKVSLLMTLTWSSSISKMNSCLAKIPYFEPLHTTRSCNATSSMKVSK